MRLSRIWKILQIEEGAISTGADNTLRDLQISSYPTKAEFNHFLSFIQNDSNFKDKLKRAYLGRC